MNKDTQLIYEAYQTQVDIASLIQEMNEAYRQDLINEGVWDKTKSVVKAGAQHLNTFNKKIHELAKKYQGTAPVQNFDKQIDGYLLVNFSQKIRRTRRYNGWLSSRKRIQVGLILLLQC